MEEIVFPNQIRMYRRLKGKSMQELADQLSVSLSAISKIEKGYRRIDQEQLVKVADFLDCPLQELFVNEQNSQPDVIQAWKREQDRRNKINEKSGLKTLGAGLRQIRNDKKLTLVGVAEDSKMTLSVYHRIEMGQREVSDNEFNNIAEALGISSNELKSQIKNLGKEGALDEIIEKNDAKYKILTSSRGAVNVENPKTTEDLPIYGQAGNHGNILIDLEKISYIARPSLLDDKKEAYALNLCTRRLGNILPMRSKLYVDPSQSVSIGDLAVYMIDEEQAMILSIKEDDNGKLYGKRWSPDEKIEISDDEINKLQKIILISL